MVWLIAILCLGLVGLTGYYQGPVRAAFSLLGIVFGALLASPLSPLTKHLLPVFGLSHPIWQIFVPQAIAFLLVLIIFKIAGHVVHAKLSLHFKYKADEKKLLRWERLYSRLGLCVGLLNGSIYFFLIMIPIYVGGYFTAEAASGSGDPAGAQFLTHTRAELHADHLDRAVAAYDPTPVQVYQAADIVTLVLHNPLLEDRLSHYPPLLTLGERPQFQDLANDVTLQQMIQSQAKVSDVLKYPKIQAIVTNADLTHEISTMLGSDLNDLQDYLTTGKSAKYDPETILGMWTVDPSETIARARKSHSLTPVQTMKLREDLFPIISGLTLTATTDNQLILKKEGPNGTGPSVVATGTWKKDGEYEVTLPGSKPETTEIKIEDGNVLLLPKNGAVVVFNKET
jgi:hypothetical protein